MRTDCGRFEELLTAYVGDRLAGPDRREVEAHLAGCADCRAALKVVRLVRDEAIPVPENLEGRIRAAVHAALDDPGQTGAPADVAPGIQGDVDRGRSRRGVPTPAPVRSWRRWAVPLAAAAALGTVWAGLEIAPGGGGGPVDTEAAGIEEVALAADSYVPVGSWPAGGGEVAGEPLLSELTTEQLEELLQELGS